MSTPIFGRIVQVGVPVLAGVLAGITTALLAGAPKGAPGPSNPSTPASHSSAIPSFARDRVGAPEVDQRIATLEKRIEELSSARVDPPSPSPAAIDFQSVREASTQRHLADHAELLQKHRSEARDLAWASGQQQQLRNALGALSETMNHSFSVQSVDCRTASCVAKLAWPSETAARRDAESFMGGSGAVRCAREMAFPPAGAAGPYTASLYLDCAEYRWGQVPGDPG